MAKSIFALLISQPSKTLDERRTNARSQRTGGPTVGATWVSDLLSFRYHTPKSWRDFRQRSVHVTYRAQSCRVMGTTTRVGERGAQHAKRKCQGGCPKEKRSHPVPNVVRTSALTDSPLLWPNPLQPLLVLSGVLGGEPVGPPHGILGSRGGGIRYLPL